MPNTIIAGPALRTGLRNTFADAYRSTAQAVAQRMTDVMEIGLPTEAAEEFYAYFESAPYPAFWPRGEEITKEGFAAIQFSVENLDWGKAVEWHKNDRRDDQIDTLFSRAQQLGNNFATLHERVFYQILEGVSDPDLLPAIPNAPDGADLYNATNGAGDDRFGLSGGNIESGNGVSAAATVRSDIFNAIERFKLFQDTKGEPLWSDSVLDAGYTVLFSAENEQVMTEALLQSPTVFAATSETSNAGVQNVILAAQLKIELRSTQRLAGNNDIFVFAKGVPQKAIFEQRRQSPEEHLWDGANDRVSAETLLEEITTHGRSGYGVFLPYATVQINN